MIMEKYLLSAGFEKVGNYFEKRFSFRGSKIAYKDLKIFLNTESEWVVLSQNEFQIANIKTPNELENIIITLQLFPWHTS